MVQSPPHVSVSVEFLDLVLLVMVMGNATGSSLGSLPLSAFLPRSPPASRGPEQCVGILSDEEEKETMGRMEGTEKARGIAGLVAQACKPSCLGRRGRKIPSSGLS